MAFDNVSKIMRYEKYFMNKLSFTLKSLQQTMEV